MDQQLIFQQIRQLKLAQDDLKRDIFEYKEDDISLVINGEMQILELNFPEKTAPEKLKRLINKALKEVQEKIIAPLQKL
jgi:DNA-binding protein YbaB